MGKEHSGHEAVGNLNYNHEIAGNTQGAMPAFHSTLLFFVSDCTRFTLWGPRAFKYFKLLNICSLCCMQCSRVCLLQHRAWQFGPGGMEDELEASFAFLSGHSFGGHGYPEVPRNLGGRPKKIKEDRKRSNLQWRRTKANRKQKAEKMISNVLWRLEATTVRS